jgi:hypothetical protein
MAVPSRTETLDDLYTSTWNNRAALVRDQIFDAVPGYEELRKKGGIKLNGTGGRYLEIPLAYAKNETVTTLGKGDTVSLSETKFMTVAQYEWKFMAGSIVRYWVDDAKNKSLSQHLAWANQKVDNLRDSMADKMEEYLFGDGTGNGGKDPDGLGNIVSTTPTTAATVANIPQTTYSWWQNRQKTATGAASVYLLSDMRNLANTCSEGQTRKMPDIIITTQVVAELFDDEVLEQRQIINVKDGADPESMSTAWKGVPLRWSSRCATGRMYMLRSDSIGLNTDPDYNFTPTEWKFIPNQPNDRVQQIVWKGNFISNRRKSLGVLTSIA